MVIERYNDDRYEDVYDAGPSQPLVLETKDVHMNVELIMKEKLGDATPQNGEVRTIQRKATT